MSDLQKHSVFSFDFTLRGGSINELLRFLCCWKSNASLIYMAETVGCDRSKLAAVFVLIHMQVAMATADILDRTNTFHKRSVTNIIRTLMSASGDMTCKTTLHQFLVSLVCWRKNPLQSFFCYFLLDFSALWEDYFFIITGHFRHWFNTV